MIAADTTVWTVVAMFDVPTIVQCRVTADTPELAYYLPTTAGTLKTWYLHEPEAAAAAYRQCVVQIEQLQADRDALTEELHRLIAARDGRCPRVEFIDALHYTVL